MGTDANLIDWPFEPTATTNEFGWRTTPDGNRNHHNGLDFWFSGIGGAALRALADGVVVEAGFHRDLGNFVRIRHTDAFGRISTGMAHMLAAPMVGVGQQVTGGQLLGFVGNTGYSFGAHLHLEFWLAGVRINPREGMRRFGTGRVVSAPVPAPAGGGGKPLPSPALRLDRQEEEDLMRIVRDIQTGRVYALAPAYCQHVRDTSTANIGVNLYPNRWRNNQAKQIELSHTETMRALDIHGVPRTAAGRLEFGEVWTPAGIINKSA